MNRDDLIDLVLAHQPAHAHSAMAGKAMSPDLRDLLLTMPIALLATAWVVWGVE